MVASRAATKGSHDPARLGDDQLALAQHRPGAVLFSGELVGLDVLEQQAEGPREAGTSRPVGGPAGWPFTRLGPGPRLGAS
jgi:hypothetical protein